MRKLVLLALAACAHHDAAPDAAPPDDAAAAPDAGVDADAAVATPWLMYGHDPGRSSATGAAIGGTLGDPVWTRTLPAGAASTGVVASEPVIDGKAAYFTSWNGLLYAVSLVDGSDVWAPVDVGLYTVPGTCNGWAGTKMGTTASPVLDLDSGTIYVAGLHGGLPELYAIEAATGGVRWQVQLADDVNDYPWSSPVLGGDRVFVGLASWGDCPLTQGALVAVGTADPHEVTRVTTAPDAVAMVGANGSQDLATAGMAPDADGVTDWDYRVVATFDASSPTELAIHLKLRHLAPDTTYDVSLGTDTADVCSNPIAIGQVTGDGAGNATADLALTMSVTDLFALRRGLTITSAGDPQFASCALLARGVGGGIWSSPTYDATTGTVFVTTGTPVPPCAAPPCQADRSTVGPRAPAIVAFEAATLAERGRYQIPLAEQDADPDFGASVTVCAGRVGAGNKNGRFYVLPADVAAGWAPLASPQLAVGGPGPETGQGIISTAACANGVFYFGGGRTPDNTTCATGQIMAIDGATGAPPAGWSAPRCAGNVIGGVSTASGVLAFGTDNCTSQPAPGCDLDSVELCDTATGASCTSIATTAPVLSGAAITDGLVVIAAGDTVAAYRATP